MVRFGGSEFINCSVPLAFEGRYFIVESGDPPLISVMREYNNQPVFEVRQNKPGDNPLSDVSRTPAGIITVSDKKTSRFMYKIRPGSETSVVFGKIDGGEISARITDKLIQVGGVTVENCAFNGVGAGIVVDSKGGVGLGCPIPPVLLQWFKRK